MQNRQSEPPSKDVKFVPNKRLQDTLKRLDAARHDLGVATRRHKTFNDQLSQELKKNGH